MARINTASQRTDLPWAFAHDALWAPVIGACAIVLAPPADHPVLALRPPKRQRRRPHDARASVRANDRSRLAATIAAFKNFMHAF